MIKYMNIPGYVNLGEVGMFSHIYQFKAKEADKDNNFNILIIRAYDRPSIMWHGNLLIKDKKAVSIEKELDLIEVEKAVGPIKIIKNFSEFISDSPYENDFKDFKIQE